MGKEHGVRPAHAAKPVSGALGLMDKPVEFAARPANDTEIDAFKSGTQLRLLEVAVVADPASNDGIVDLGQILQGLSLASVP
jgi:hypothetical protein